MMEFFVDRLKGVENRYWTDSRPALKKTIISRNLVIPDFVDDVAKTVGVWPLIVLYLKETKQKDDGVSLVVSSPNVEFLCHCFVPVFFAFFGV